MQTRDQKYAEDVYKRVMAIKQTEDQGLATSYGVMAHKLPILIHTSGLVQALTFVGSRTTNSKAYTRLLNDLSRTVLEISDGEEKPKERLLDAARGKPEGSLQAYIHLTRQVLAALLWYKRYAQSILQVEQGDQDENNTEGDQSNDRATEAQE